MKDKDRNLLPKLVSYREALIGNLTNIKPRFFPNLRDIKRLKNILFKLPIMAIIILSLLGIYPVLDFPPVRQAVVKADTTDTQKAEVISDNLPEAITLPHPGYLSTKFSFYHPGVDIATGLGMPIHPIASGSVEQVNYDLWGLGHHVIITHQAGYRSIYAHMGRVYVKKGQSITPNSTLGEVGLTGRTSGPHTHLEITKNGQYIDPLNILPKVPDYPRPEDFQPVVTGGSEKITKTDLKKILKPDFN